MPPKRTALGSRIWSSLSSCPRRPPSSSRRSTRRAQAWRFRSGDWPRRSQDSSTARSHCVSRILNRERMRQMRRERHRGPVIANGAQELADDGMLDAMVVDHVSGAGGRRRFTADEYQRMGQVGILSDDERVELVEGEILTMSPIYSPHAAAVDRANRVMNMTAGAQAIVRVQNPIRLNLFSEPQPDIVLLHP